MANEVQIIVTGDSAKAEQALSGIGDRLKGLGDRARAMRGPFLAVTAAVTGLGVLSVKSASDLEESVNKANEVFGESVSLIREFAETSAETFGISERAANEYAGTLGTILRASGLAKDAAANMSIGMVQLAADLASFNNIPIDVALEKIRSGLVGEVEPLRTVGVLLNQAAVEAKAMELGLIGADGELTEAAKVQARYALILEQTTTQQGDFTRTSEGLANSMRIAKAQLEDTAASLGQMLIPVATKALGAIRGLLEVFTNLPGPVKQAIVIVAGLAAGIAAVGLIIPPLIAGITAVGTALTLATGPIGIIVVALAGLVAAGIAVWKNWDAIKEKAAEFWTFLQQIFRSGANVIIGIAEGMVNRWINGINTMIKAANKVTGIIPGFGDALQIPTIPTLNLPRLAHGGGIRQAGMALVGEHGPEIVSLPRGAQVSPLGAGNGINVTLINYGVLGMTDAEEWVVRTFRSALDRGGFSDLARR